MARVEYSGVPESAPDLTRPDGYQKANASPEAFGAGIAQGVKTLGDEASGLASFYGKTAADNATNNTLQQVTSVLSGDPSKQVPGPGGTMQPDTGYFGLRGAAAMEGREETSKRIQEIIQEQREGLQTPEARLQYDNESRRYQAQWLREIGSHADGQQRTWTDNTADNKILLNGSDLARNPLDSGNITRTTDNIISAYRTKAILNGEDPAGAELKGHQYAAHMQVTALLADHPLEAQKALRANAPLLASLPDYDQLTFRVDAKAQAVQGRTGVDEIFSTIPSQGRPVGSVVSAILGQESGGNDNAPMSAKGAIGPMQVEPATFQRFAQPGEVITNPADNRKVGQRYIDYLSKLPNVQGDQQRIAVGYFSGEHNIAPLGSPTPWIKDSNDGKTSVSQYVSGITGRMGGSAPTLGRAGPPAFTSQADYINANYPQIIQSVRDKAEQIDPGNTELADHMVSLADQRARSTIHQQTAVNKANADTVYQALGGAYGKPPTNMQELEATSPDVKAVLDYMLTADPTRYKTITSPLLTANSGGKASVVGTQYWPVLNRILAPEGDPARILDQHQWSQLVLPGEKAPVTNTGSDQLNQVLLFRGQPGGEAKVAQLRTFLNQVRGQLSFSNPRAGVVDHNGDAKFEAFVPQAIQIFMKGDAAQLLNPKSPDYLGNMAQQFARSPADRLKDFMHDTPSTAGGAAVLSQFSQLKSTDERQKALKGAVSSGAISRNEGIRIGIEMGYISPNATSPAR